MVDQPAVAREHAVGVAPVRNQNRHYGLRYVHEEDVREPRPVCAEDADSSVEGADLLSEVEVPPRVQGPK